MKYILHIAALTAIIVFSMGCGGAADSTNTTADLSSSSEEGDSNNLSQSSTSSDHGSSEGDASTNDSSKDSEESSQGEGGDTTNPSSDGSQTPSSDESESSGEEEEEYVPPELREHELFHFHPTFTPEVNPDAGGCTNKTCPYTLEKDGEVVWEYVENSKGWAGLAWAHRNDTFGWDDIEESFDNPVAGATCLSFEAKSDKSDRTATFSSAIGSIVIKSLSKSYTTYTIAAHDSTLDYSEIKEGFAVYLSGDDMTLSVKNIQYCDDPSITYWIENVVEEFESTSALSDDWEAKESTFFREGDHDGPGENGWGYFGSDYVTQSPDNSRIEDGKLIIEARHQPGFNKEYSTARVTSTNHYRYGKFEVKLKAPSSNSGVMDGAAWPAFWLLGSHGAGGECAWNTWPNCGEIDIFEIGGKDDTRVLGTTIRDGDSSDPSVNEDQQGDSHYHSDPLQDDFHTYAVEWGPDKIAFFFDGINYFTDIMEWEDQGTQYSKVEPFSHEAQIILNIAVGSPNSKFLEYQTGNPDPTNYPQTMEIEYFKHWHKHNDQWNID